jgi:hypothetical protein
MPHTGLLIEMSMPFFLQSFFRPPQTIARRQVFTATRIAFLRGGSCSALQFGSVL